MSGSLPRQLCAHCGLSIAVTATVTGDSGALYCCQACRLVALLVGKQGGAHEGKLLGLGLGTLLSMNVMMISLLLYSGGIEPQTTPIFRLVLLGLATPALAVLLPPFLAGAWRECTARQLSLDALIACGSLAAFCVSAVNTLRGAGPVYFDTATMLPVLVTFGKIIESCAKSRAGDLLKSLQSLLPESALLVEAAQRVTAAEKGRTQRGTGARGASPLQGVAVSSPPLQGEGQGEDGGTTEVPLHTLGPGDLIRVRPGERVAVDGVIREGTSCIEEAPFTGEFQPRRCAPGDRVLAGTVNGAGSLLVQAERTGTDLLLHGIVALVENAWSAPSHSERIAQRAASLFIPLLLLLAAGTLIGWACAGNLTQAMLSTLSVLVVACPCTMGIATPLATSLAIARAARSGIVVRGGRVMEEMAQLNLAFFDKTGTLTEGRPVLSRIEVLDPALDERELLGRLATLESAGGHLLARVVAAEAQRRRAGIGSVSAVHVQPGAGMRGAVNWGGVRTTVVAGSPSYVRAALAAGGGTEASPQATGSLVEVAWDGRLRGRLEFSDTVRPGAARCVESLAGRNIPSVLLSGDRLAAAHGVAVATSIPEVLAPRTPEQKLQVIEAARAAGSSVAMVGDGVNDAPALAAAQVGIAFGAGTDLPRQAGNVVILSGSLEQIPWLIDLSRRTARIIRGNFAWSFGYNGIALAAAAAGLLHPLLAALAMAASSLTVLGNSLRVAAFPDSAPSCDDQAARAHVPPLALRVDASPPPSPPCPSP